MLTPTQLDSYHRAGFVVIPGAVSRSAVGALMAEIWGGLGRRGCDPRTRSTWERWPESIQGSGFVDFFPAFHLEGGWANRQNPRVYESFADVLGTRELVVSIDRINLKRPTRVPGGHRPDWRGRGFVHHDLNLWHPPRTHQVQGLIALTEAKAAADGGFWCIPGFHHEASEWANANRHRAAPAGQTLVEFLDPDECASRLTCVPLQVGDLLIWNALLPHGSSPNDGAEFRACQYIRMFPAAELGFEERAARVESYRTGAPPARFSTGANVAHGACSETRSAVYEPPLLTQLGRRLLGIEPW